MIVDCVTFFNEYDILEARLRYLDKHVDRFVIVESDIMFSGESKPYNFEQEQSRYQPWMDKITYLKFSPDTSGLDFSIKPTQLDFSAAHWRIENSQRDHLTTALIEQHGDDVILISDVDEIPNKDLFKDLPGITQNRPAVALEQRMFYYNLKQCQKNPWCGTVAATARQIRLRGAQWCRDNRWVMPRLADGGWHLSYFADAKQIQFKVQNFAHQEFNDPRYTDLEAIEKRIQAGQDLFDRENNPFEPFDAKTLPKDFSEIFGKFA